MSRGSRGTLAWHNVCSLNRGGTDTCNALQRIKMSFIGARGAFATQRGSVLRTIPPSRPTNRPAVRHFASTRPRAQQQQRRPPSWSQHIKYGAGVAVIAGIASFCIASAQHLSKRVYSDAAPVSKDSTTPSESDSSRWHIDPSTSLKLPRRLPSPASYDMNDSDKEPFVIIASGVRTVSFLRIQVYVASLYMHESLLEQFLSTQPTSSQQNQNLEQLLRCGLEAGVPTILKITPVRNTDFAHLRDGFARAIQLRLKHIRKNSSTPLTSEQEESLAVSLQHLKECFPKTSLKKGEDLDIVFQRAASLVVSDPIAAAAANAVGGVDVSLVHAGKVLGSVQYDGKGGDLDIGKLLLQAYAAEKEPVSDVFKKALEDKLL